MTEVAATTPSLPVIGYTTAIPESARAGGRSGGENIYLNFMQNMPAPAPGKKGGPTQFAWFFVPSVVPDTIVGTEEREKAAKANATKLVNRFTSLSRRIRKENSATHDYTFRKGRDPNDTENGEWGLIVYRVVPGTDKGGPKKAAA